MCILHQIRVEIDDSDVDLESSWVEKFTVDGKPSLGFLCHLLERCFTQ